MKEVKQQLEARIRKLERELQDELPKALQKAREMGDLRENAEYQAAKERQTYVQAELGNLKQRLAKLSLVNLDKIPHGKVSYGSIVVLHDMDRDQEVTYRLVTSEEADVQKHPDGDEEAFHKRFLEDHVLGEGEFGQVKMVR